MELHNPAEIRAVIHRAILTQISIVLTVSQSNTYRLILNVEMKLYRVCRLGISYSQIELRDQVTDLIASDVNKSTRADTGRQGLSYWQILRLGMVRLGCNLNYDKLQDLCENHRALRGVLSVGDWYDTSFHWQRSRDTPGRLLIARANAKCEAARSKRKRVA